MALEPPLPGAPVAPAEGQWYVQDPKTRQPQGPWTVAQMRVRWQYNRIDGLALVWRSGFKSWQPLAEISELKEELREIEPITEESEEPGRGTKRKRRMSMDSIPLTHTYTSKTGILLVYDTIDNDWKTSDIYEDLVAQEVEPEVVEELKTSEVEPAADANDTPKVADTSGEVDNLTPEAEEALRELFADVEKGNTSLGGGGDGTTLLGLKGHAKVLAQAQAAADATPLTAEQEAKAKKKREYRQRKKLKRQAGLFMKAQVNCNVYVSGLPPDVTLQELEPVFKRGGVIKVDVETGDSKIRIYADDEGRCKGDALVSYANAESVDLAIKFLHEFELRPNCRIAVQEADFDDKEVAPKLSTEELKELASKRNLTGERKKMMAARNLEKEAVSWSGEMDDGTGRRIVLLKHMFSLEEAEKEGPEFWPELAEEVKEECEKVGQVAKVNPIEGHKQGIVTVKFRSSAEAEECIRVMDGRFFAGRTIEACFYDGKTDLRALGTTSHRAATKLLEGRASSMGPATASQTPVLSSDPLEEEEEDDAEGEETTDAPSKPAPEEKGNEKTWDEWLQGDSDDSDDSDIAIQTEE